jgi:hypothetical protein
MRTITGAAIIAGVGWSAMVNRQLAKLESVPHRLDIVEDSVVQNQSELAVLNTKIEYMVQGIDEIRAILVKGQGER